MSSSTAAIVVPIVGSILTLLGIYLTASGPRKTKQVELKAAAEAEILKQGNTAYDQIQEDLGGAREEIRKLTEMVDRQRTATDEAWGKITEVRKSADAEIALFRKRAQTEMDELTAKYKHASEMSERYIELLLMHIEEQLPPPPPLRPRS